MKRFLRIGFLSIKSWLFLFLICFGFQKTIAQDSKGTEFWICFPGNLSNLATQLYITGANASTVTINIPGIAFNQVVNVPAGGLQVVNLPATVQVQSQFTPDNKGIHITATNEVTVYGMNAQSATTDAFLAFPLDAIGMQYYILGYNKDFSFPNPTQATIVATQNNTTVTITTNITDGGFTAGVPSNVVLQQGQVFQLRSLLTNSDYTGTKVIADKPISVFGGAQCTNISGNLRACDHLVEQLPPLNSWGKSFVTVPLATRLQGDVFRFLAQNNGTQVSVNGVVVANLNAGQSFETILGSATYNRITSNEPILVGQYSRSSQADNVTSDPFFSLVPPDEQFLNSYVVSAGTSNIPINFLNITSPTPNINTVLVDGVVVNPALWNAIPGTNFSGAKVPVSNGVHTVSSSLPIGLLVYGFGNFDSYGYLGGQSFAAVATVSTVELQIIPGETANVGTQYCIKAKATTSLGDPVSGVRVDFVITGANPINGFAFTDANGVATFCYTGNNPGVDHIVASIGSISDNADLTWLAAPSNVYYSKSTGDLHDVLTWGLNADGSGANPSDFGDRVFQLANRPAVYTMTDNWTVGGTINIPAASELQINGHTLSEASLAGPGTLSGSTTSNLIVTGTSGGDAGLLKFTTGSEMLNDLTVNRTGAAASATLGTQLNILNVLTIGNGTLFTGNMLTLKSTAANTARVAPIFSGSINGNVTVERYIPARRAWRILSAPVGGISGSANMTHSQETVQGTLTTTGGNPRPLSYGMATFSLNQSQTALTMTATIFNIDVTGAQTPGDNNDNLMSAHIHVGAPPGVNAPVRWGFFGAPDNDINPKQLVVTPFASGVGGTFTSTWDLPEGNAGTTLTTNLPGILAGLSYLNFHTVQFAGGEIRGQITMAGPAEQTINQGWQEGSILGLSANSNPFPGYGTHITGGPVYGSTANGFDQNPGAASSIKKYNSTVNNWEILQNTNATSIGADAYMTFVRGDRGIALGVNTVPPTNTTLRATGSLKIGDQVFPVSGTGFTAIPNPFASPINFATITRNGVQNNFYLWDPKMGGTFGVGAYVLLSFNGVSYDVIPAAVSPESQYIQSGQGFLVRATTPGVAGSIVVKESDKSATPATDVFRIAGGNLINSNAPVIEDPKNGQGLRINLQAINSDHTTSLLDEVFSSYKNTYADKIDNLDGFKITNEAENLGIIRDGQTLVVERRTMVKEDDVIQLKLWNTSAKSYLLEVNPIGLAGTGLSAFLEDKYLKTFTPVSLSKISQVYFNITSDVSSGRPDRFQVILTKKAPDALTTIMGKGTIAAYPNPVIDNRISLWFNNKPAGNYQVTLMNSVGQVVYRKNLQHAGGSSSQMLAVDGKMGKGVYQLRVSDKEGTTTIPIVSN